MHNISHFVFLLPIVLTVSILISSADAVDTDGDGLLDLIDVPGFDPNATEIVIFESHGIQDLDGASLLTNLQTLGLAGNQFTELNLAGATFENLVTCGGVFGVFGFCAFSNTTTRLILDDAVLSLGSFNAIVRETPFITDVSLVGLTFSDSLPAGLDNVLGIATLDNVPVDQPLFDVYSDEFTAFSAMPDNTVTVVPEPAGLFSLLIAILGLMAKSRIRLR